MKFQPKCEEEKQAEREGETAMHKGQYWSDNPYREGTMLYLAWRRGYQRLLDQYRDTY